MMFCPKCGHPNSDQARFCRECGTPLPEQASKPNPGPAPSVPPVQPGKPNPDFSQAIPPVQDGRRDFSYNSSPQVPPSPENRVFHTITAMIGSPLFLVGVIAYSLTVLLNMIQVFQNNPFQSMLALSRYTTPDMYSLYSAFSAGSGLYIFLSLLVQIPAMLILTGIWITFVTSKTSQNRRPSTAGLTIIRVVSIIQLVLFCLIIFVLEIVCVIAIAGINEVRSAAYAYGYYDSGSSATVLIIFVMIVVAIVAALCILYYIKLFKTVGEMVTTIQTGIPSDRISAYVAVFTIIGGACSVIGMFISTIVTASMRKMLYPYHFGSGPQVMLILGSICSATAAIAFGIFLFSYRNRMRMCMQPPRGGYYPNPGGGQFAPVPQPERKSESGSDSILSREEIIERGEETQAFDPGDSTMILNHKDSCENVQRTICPYLIQPKTGIRIAVDKPSFWLGSDPGAVDYCIPNNPTVSRHHAQVMMQNGQFYIVDNHSTNHVYVNNQIAQPGVPVVLENGSKVLLSDEAFVFQIERI